MSHIILNHQLISQDSFNAGIDNRAFNYGDGLFETIVVKNLKVEYWEDHLLRLKKGVIALGMIIPEDFNEPVLKEDILNLLEKNGFKGNARIKLLVWRKNGGLYSPHNQEINFIITSSELKLQPEIKNQLFFYKAIRTSYSTISSFKTINALPYICASIERDKQKADDMILLDVFGNISECTASNIFWEKDGEIFTPSLESGCIEGVIRKQIIQILQKDHVKVHEGLYQEKLILESDFVFTSNSAGISIVKKIEDRTFKTASEIVTLIKSKLH